jgi:hypothetical protein
MALVAFLRFQGTLRYPHFKLRLDLTIHMLAPATNLRLPDMNKIHEQQSVRLMGTHILLLNNSLRIHMDLGQTKSPVLAPRLLFSVIHDISIETAGIHQMDGEDHLWRIH